MSLSPEILIEKIPFIYHLTDKRNLEFIKHSQCLFSTVEIAKKANFPDIEPFLKSRRPQHTKLKIDEWEIWIRDQRPLNAALDKCLTNGWLREQFIYLLNSRVFFWPNLKRLNVHFSRYHAEEPIIFRIHMSNAIEENFERMQLCHLNSGATRPLPIYGGKAPARGIESFLAPNDYEKGHKSIAEVTFLDFFKLPNNVQISNTPDGEWIDF